MRIFLGGLEMESDSFTPILATTQVFQDGVWLEKPEDYRLIQHTSSQICGAYEALEEARADIVAGFFARTASSFGPLADKDFFELTRRIMASLKEAGPVDGAVFVFHGALVSESVRDCEGYILESARSILGDDVPITASFDLHGQVTRKKVKNLSGLAGYYTFPHVDHFQTGYRASKYLLYLILNHIRPKKIWKRIPAIIALDNADTISGPMAPVYQKAKAHMESGEWLSGGVFMIQPWLDTEENGFAVCAFFEDEQDRAKINDQLDELLDYVWENRTVFYPPLPRTKEAVERAKAMEKPVMLIDYGDVPGSGSTGDGTDVLKHVLEADLDFMSCITLYDPESVRQAVEIGVGQSGTFHVGGFGKPGEFNERIEVNAKVLRLNDEPFYHKGPAQKGVLNNPGTRALLQVGNVFIILCEKLTVPFDPNMLTTMGVEPLEMGLIGMKTTHSCLENYRGIIRSVIYADTPGYARRSVWELPFQHCIRPIYPLDEMADVTRRAVTEVYEEQ